MSSAVRGAYGGGQRRSALHLVVIKATYAVIGDFDEILPAINEEIGRRKGGFPPGR